jgi:hypothetical protein
MVMQDRPEKYEYEVFEINNEIKSAYAEMGLSDSLPKRIKSIFKPRQYAPSVIGGWQQTTIGISLEPNITISHKWK